MFLIRCPEKFKDERIYCINVIFNILLGLQYEFLFEKRNNFLVTYTGSDKELHIQNAWQNKEDGFWLRTVPDNQNLEMRHITEEFLPESLEPGNKIPCLSVNSNEVNEINNDSENKLTIPFDLFDSAFYMLSRMEESLSPDRDSHDRFPASASHAFQNNYLHRPIVDEYVEILWHCMKKLWPGLKRKERTFQMQVTHDVDSPFGVLFKKASQMVRSCGCDVLKRKSPGMAVKRLNSWVKAKTGDYSADFHNTFDFIMDVAEENNLSDAFYFIPMNDHDIDGNYDLENPAIKDLMTKIYNRGHEIGYHGSYQTYKDPERTKQEVTRLKQVCSSLSIEQNIWGGRQHYLRWNVPQTWRNYAEAGLNYDTTLSYADHAGFRCGTSHPFPVYDLEQRKALDLWESPLIAMECSVLDDKYMNLDSDEAFNYMAKLKKTCRKYNGTFSLLWHNSRLIDQKEIELYKAIVKD